MKFSTNFVVLAAFITAATAQTPASDADVATVSQALDLVISAVTNLDQQVVAFTGVDDAGDLAAASSGVLQALNDGTTEIQKIQGTLSITQAALLLPQVDDLNNVVAQATQDVKNQKPILVSACLGPTVLDQLNQLLASATTFRDTIVSKLDLVAQPIADEASQPSLDSLSDAISYYSDQTSLPPSCNSGGSSSAAPSGSTPAASSSTGPPAYSSTPPTGSSTTASSGPDTVTPSSGAVPMSACPTSSRVPISKPTKSKGARTTITTTVCSTSSQAGTVTTTICSGGTVCACANGGCMTSTGPAKYTGGAASAIGKVDALAMLGVVAAMAF